MAGYNQNFNKPAFTMPQQQFQPQPQRFQPQLPVLPRPQTNLTGRTVNAPNLGSPPKRNLNLPTNQAGTNSLNIGPGNYSGGAQNIGYTPSPMPMNTPPPPTPSAIGGGVQGTSNAGGPLTLQQAQMLNNLGLGAQISMPNIPGGGAFTGNYDPMFNPYGINPFSTSNWTYQDGYWSNSYSPGAHQQAQYDFAGNPLGAGGQVYTTPGSYGHDPVYGSNYNPPPMQIQRHLGGGRPMLGDMQSNNPAVNVPFGIQNNPTLGSHQFSYGNSPNIQHTLRPRAGGQFNPFAGARGKNNSGMSTLMDLLSAFNFQ